MITDTIQIIADLGKGDLSGCIALTCRNYFAVFPDFEFEYVVCRQAAAIQRLRSLERHASLGGIHVVKRRSGRLRRRQVAV